MGGCSAVNCSNHSRNGFRMIKFPKEEERRKKWVINCGRYGWVPSPHAQICIVHFEESQFEAKVKGKLRKNAVPTVFNKAKEPKSNKRLKRTCSKNYSEEEENPDEIHFEENQFELHREDGWKKLKPNAIPTHFPEPPESSGSRKWGSSRRKITSNNEDVKQPKKKGAKRKQNESSERKSKIPKKKMKKGEVSSDHSEASLKENSEPRRRKGRPRKIRAAEPIYCQDSSDTEIESLGEEQEILSLKRENESMRREIQEFEKHNKSMTRVILELEKHNKAMALKLQELDKENRVMSKKLQDLENQNEDLRSKLNCCFSEEQYARMEKLVSLGKIERYIPGIK